MPYGEPPPWWTGSCRATSSGGRLRGGGRRIPGGRRPVHDSTVPHGPALCFEATAWAAFIGELKAGHHRP
ncbi:DUF397 domain-containing protein [Streptomyces chromofuscus]|uniref:DUF397 domain-containing protein n=1 Tax=Streptomyces chromofuscus TaxID=42881 RepID=UPI001E5A11E1|nr:DUF397 domain-containing protein [Streptomyces chromofuscus]